MNYTKTLNAVNTAYGYLYAFCYIKYYFMQKQQEKHEALY